MEIIVKNRKEKKVNIEDSSSIDDLLKKLGINRETVLTSRNGVISLEEEVLEEGDIVEIIPAISGG